MRWVIIAVLVLAIVGFVAQGLGAIRSQRDVEAADRAKCRSTCLGVRCQLYAGHPGDEHVAGRSVWSTVGSDQAYVDRERLAGPAREEQLEALKRLGQLIRSEQDPGEGGRRG